MGQKHSHREIDNSSSGSSSPRNVGVIQSSNVALPITLPARTNSMPHATLYARGVALGLPVGVNNIQLGNPSQVKLQYVGVPFNHHSSGSCFAQMPIRAPLMPGAQWSPISPPSSIPLGDWGNEGALLDSMWFDEFMRFIWPKVGAYMGDKLRATTSKMAISMKAAFPPSFWRGIDKFAKDMANHPMIMPPQTSWFNQFLADLWGLLSPNFKDLMEDLVLPRIREKLPSLLKNFHVDPCTIGKTPPRITEIKAVPRTEGNPYVDLIIGLEWQSDSDICIHLPANLVSAGITSIHMAMELHVCFMEILDSPPFFGGINVWTVKPPKFSLDWTGALDILDSNMFEAIIHKQFNQTLSSMLVLPNRYGFTMDKSIDIFRVLRPPPKGLLKIEILKASGLRCDDFNFSTLWTGKRTSDPYVVTDLASFHWRTTTVGHVSGEAEWEESHYFIIDEPFDQQVNFTIYDEDKLSADDLLARKKHVSLPELLGCNCMDQHVFEREMTRKQSLKLEVLWAKKAQRGNSTQAKEHKAEEHNAEQNTSGIMNMIRSATSKSTNWLRQESDRLRDEIDKHTGANEEDWEKLDSELELVATWRPFEFDPCVAKWFKPEMNAHEHISSMLFVGIDTCYHLPHQAELKTKYWAVIECLPYVNEDGEDIVESGDDTQQKTSQKKPKVGKKPEPDADSQEELARKVALLLTNGAPPEVIMTVLEITPAQLDAALENSYHDPTFDPVDIAWQQGFTFLLADPRPSYVKIEVFKKDKEDVSIGTFTYPVAQLLQCDMLTDFQKRKPLIGDYPDVRISMKFQLHPFFMQNRAFLQQYHKAAPVTAPIAPVKPRKQKIVYLDRLGRQKVQVGGIWLQEDEEKHDAGTTIGEKIHHAVEAGEKFIDKMLHGSTGHAAGSTAGPSTAKPGTAGPKTAGPSTAGPNTAGINPVPMKPQIPFAAPSPIVNVKPVGVPATHFGGAVPVNAQGYVPKLVHVGMPPIPDKLSSSLNTTNLSTLYTRTSTSQTSSSFSRFDIVQ